MEARLRITILGIAHGVHVVGIAAEATGVGGPHPLFGVDVLVRVVLHRLVRAAPTLGTIDAYRSAFSPLLALKATHS